MEAMIKTTGGNNLQFVNKRLQNATMQIMRIAGKIRNNWFEVGAIIAQVEAEGLYKEDEFKTVHEWTARAFNIKKSMSYDLLKIGREYTRTLTSDKGKITGYECNLIDTESPTADNFEVTQVIRMLPAGHDTAKTLVDAGIITPDMSSTKIGKIIKDYTNPKTEDPAEEPVENVTEEPTEEPAEVSREEWLKMTFEKIGTTELIAELVRRGFVVMNQDQAKGGEDNDA